MLVDTIDERMNIIESALIVNDDELERISRSTKARKLPKKVLFSFPRISPSDTSIVTDSDITLPELPLDSPKARGVYSTPAYSTKRNISNKKKLTQYFGDTQLLYNAYMSTDSHS